MTLQSSMAVIGTTAKVGHVGTEPILESVVPATIGAFKPYNDHNDPSCSQRRQPSYRSGSVFLQRGQPLSRLRKTWRPSGRNEWRIWYFVRGVGAGRPRGLCDG